MLHDTPALRFSRNNLAPAKQSRSGGREAEHADTAFQIVLAKSKFFHRISSFFQLRLLRAVETTARFALF
jgi:hypothetical protein